MTAKGVFISLVVLLTLGSNGVSDLTPAQQLALPKVGPLDATFVGDHTIAVQSDGIVGHQRFLSLWDSWEQRWIRSAAITSPESRGRWVQCPRVTYLSAANQLAVCGTPSQILLIDVNNLASTRQLALDRWTITSDFAINEATKTIYAVGLTRGKGETISAYNLNTSGTQRQTLIPNFDDTLPALMTILPSEREPQIAVYSQTNRGRGRIAICRDAGELRCTTFETQEGVADLEFVDAARALFVSSRFADRSAESRHNCIKKISLATGKVDDRAYCSDTGAHYTLALINQTFVLGYSGYATYNPITENSKNVSDYLTVWDSNSGLEIARAQVPAVPGIMQNASHVVAGNSDKKEFLFFNSSGSVVLLFDLSQISTASK